MLPLVEHFRARWAAWLFRLVAGDGRAPWEAVAAELIALLQPGLTPLGLLAFAASEMRVRCLPQPLRRWCEGVRALPAVELLEEEEAAAAEPEHAAGQVEGAAPPAASPPPGWHAAMPIMYNPLIRLPPDKGGGYLAEEYGSLALAGVSTIPDLYARRAAIRNLGLSGVHPADWLRLARDILGDAMADYHMGNPRASPTHSAMAYISKALGDIPADLTREAYAEQERVKRGELQLPSAAEVEAFLARRLGWCHAGRTVLLCRFRVRHGTAWQLEAQQATRRDRKLLPYVRLALAGAPDAELPEADLAEGEASLMALLRRVWRVRWDNNYKVTLWWLVQNGLPVSARMPDAGSKPCGCGAGVNPSGGLLDRSHHFWVCPVAREVVASVVAQLPAAQRPLSRRALWLGEAPEGIHGGIWVLVCLAAIEAMERARALARRRERERRERQAQQTSQQTGPSGRVQLTLERGDDGRLGLAAPPEEPQDVPLLAPG